MIDCIRSYITSSLFIAKPQVPLQNVETRRLIDGNYRDQSHNRGSEPLDQIFLAMIGKAFGSSQSSFTDSSQPFWTNFKCSISYSYFPDCSVLVY